MRPRRLDGHPPDRPPVRPPAPQPQWDTCTIARQRSAAAASAANGARRLLEAYALAARAPEAQGRAVMEGAVREVARALAEAREQEQRRVGALQGEVERRLADLDARRASAERVLGAAAR